MQPVADKLNETARGIVSQAPTIPMASNVSGTWFNNSGVASDYWSRHVTSRVLWSANVEKLLQWEPDIILEIGPGAVLTNLIGKHLRGRAAAKQPIILPSLSDFSEAPMENECRFLSMLGTLWSHGASINWEKFHESHGGPPKLEGNRFYRLIRSRKLAFGLGQTNPSMSIPMQLPLWCRNQIQHGALFGLQQSPQLGSSSIVSHSLEDLQQRLSIGRRIRPIGWI